LRTVTPERSRVPVVTVKTRSTPPPSMAVVSGLGPPVTEIVTVLLGGD